MHVLRVLKVFAALRTKTSNQLCFADASKLISCNKCIYCKTMNGQFLLFQALGISHAPGLGE